ncbi:hypothetical protein Dsin_013199 [Dipteronia sinensis]|uniref:Uncharacterized protein n=1 Tax=Dipteronia sinensis TaxID=43782 RepID=A0AAE0AKS8_9ROSI|nr:hypothetical protein Dsin_013199 [Dipteronia sinensis]
MRPAPPLATEEANSSSSNGGGLHKLIFIKIEIEQWWWPPPDLESGGDPSDHHRRRRLLFSLATAAFVQQDTTAWTPTILSQISLTAESLFHISIDVSDAPDLAKPIFLAIASPLAFASTISAFEFLVKSVVDRLQRFSTD